MNFPKSRKWAIAILQSLSTFAVTFASSVYVSSIEGVVRHFDVSQEVLTLGLSLFVLGFALGPLIWAPLSEAYGRKSVYMISFTAYMAFSVGAACAPNITGLLVLRFLASAFGSSSMTSTGGVIADMVRQGGARIVNFTVCHCSLFRPCIWYALDGPYSFSLLPSLTSAVMSCQDPLPVVFLPRPRDGDGISV